MRREVTSQRWHGTKFRIPQFWDACTNAPPIWTSNWTDWRAFARSFWPNSFTFYVSQDCAGYV